MAGLENFSRVTWCSRGNSRTKHQPQRRARELLIIADASEKAIAAVVFLKTCSSSVISNSIVLGKAKVSPKHSRTMPRLELCAAVLALEKGVLMQENLKLAMDTTLYYSDSRKVVQGYIQHRTRRF